MNVRSWVLFAVAAVILVGGLMAPPPSSAIFEKLGSSVTLPDGAPNVLRGTGAAQTCGRVDVTEATVGTLSPTAALPAEVVFTIQTSGVTFSTPPSATINNTTLLEGGAGTIRQRPDAAMAGQPAPLPQGLAGPGITIIPGIANTAATTRINTARTAITVSISNPSSGGPATIRLQNCRFDVAGSAALGPITIRVSGSATAPAAHGITTQDVSNATIVDAGTSTTVTTSPVPQVLVGRLDRSAGTVRVRELVPGSISPNADGTACTATACAGADVTMTLPAGVVFGASMGTGPLAVGAAPAFVSIANFAAGAANNYSFLSGRTVAAVELGTLNNAAGAVVGDVLFNESSGARNGLALDVASTVASGPINVTITGASGSNISSATVAPAVAVTGGTTAVASGPAPANVVIGRAAQGQSGTTILLAEVAPQTLTGGVGLGIDLTAPTGVTLTAVPATAGVAGFALGAGSLTTGNRTATYPVTASSTTTAGSATFGPFSFNLAFTVPVGAIQLSVGGTAGATAANVTVANAIRATTATSPTTPIRAVVIGTQNQPAGDIEITEAFAGALEAATTTGFTLTLPPGVTFAARPTVTVTTGNITLAAVADPTGTRTLTIVPTAASTVASKITISGISVTLDNTVPVGSLGVTIRNGDAAVPPVTAAATRSRPFEETVNIAQVSPGTRPVLTAPAANAIVTRGQTTTLSWTTETPQVAANYALEFTCAGRSFANPRATAADPVNGFGSTCGGGGFITGPATTTSLAVVPSTAAPTGTYEIRIFPLSATFTVPSGVTSSDSVRITLQ
jgi:hypothetical protein